MRWLTFLNAHDLLLLTTSLQQTYHAHLYCPPALLITAITPAPKYNMTLSIAQPKTMCDLPSEILGKVSGFLTQPRDERRGFLGLRRTCKCIHKSMQGKFVQQF